MLAMTWFCLLWSMGWFWVCWCALKTPRRLVVSTTFPLLRCNVLTWKRSSFVMGFCGRNFMFDNNWEVLISKKNMFWKHLEEQLVSRASECVTEICFCTAYFVCTVACCGCLFYVLFFTDIHCCMFFIPGAGIFALMKSSCSTFSWVSRDFYNPNFELEQSI